MRPLPAARARALLLWAIAAAAALLVAVGCQEGSLSLEEQAQEIDRSLMCPVCPSETVDQSQVQLAKQMRAIIREKLAGGESRQQILDFFVSRYGESVLAAPPKRGFNLVAWVAPGVGLLAGAAVLVLALRAMRQGRAPLEADVAPPPRGEDIEPYLLRVDEELRGVLGGEGPRQAPHPPAGGAKG